jgi:hypothetical protein
LNDALVVNNFYSLKFGKPSPGHGHCGNMIFTMARHFPLGSGAEMANPSKEAGNMKLANLSLVMAIVAT